MSQLPYDLCKRHVSQGINTTGQSMENIDQAAREVESSPNLVSVPEENPEENDKESTEELVEIPVVMMEDFQQVDMNEKLDLLMSAINKINTTFHYKFEALNKRFDDKSHGIIPRLEALETQTSQMQTSSTELSTRVAELENSNAQLKDELSTLKGLMQVNDNLVTNLSTRVVDLTARSMSNNVIIMGIMGNSENEDDCKVKTLRFMRTQLKIEDLADTEVEVAHRAKGKIGVKPRPMIVRCQFTLRDRIFKFTKKLKDVTNSQGDPYFVSKQLPEPLYTQKKERDQRIKEICRGNKQLTPDQQHKKIKIQVKNNMLYLNKIPQKKHVTPPTVCSIYNLNVEDKDKMEKLQIFHFEPTQDKSSVFRGHALKVQSTTDIRLAYNRIKLLYPESDHIMVAYTIKGYSGHHDNGEHGASVKMAKILADRCLQNTAVYVTREYGGIHLGPRRFVNIKKVAKQALDELRFSI